MSRPRISFDYDVLLNLHAQGYSDSMMAKSLGINRETLRRHRKRLGLKANREPGQRGPSIRPDEPYWEACKRLLTYTGRYISEAIVKCQQDQSADDVQLFLAQMLYPRNLTHPQPSKYYCSIDSMTDHTIETAIDFESKQAAAGIAGVPGPTILELAQVCRTAAPETIISLAVQAVRESGIVSVYENVDAVMQRGTTEYIQWDNLWREYKEEARTWLKNVQAEQSESTEGHKSL